MVILIFSIKPSVSQITTTDGEACHDGMCTDQDVVLLFFLVLRNLSTAVFEFDAVFENCGF